VCFACKSITRPSLYCGTGTAVFQYAIVEFLCVTRITGRWRGLVEEGTWHWWMSAHCADRLLVRRTVVSGVVDSYVNFVNSCPVHRSPWLFTVCLPLVVTDSFALWRRLKWLQSRRTVRFLVGPCRYLVETTNLVYYDSRPSRYSYSESKRILCVAECFFLSLFFTFRRRLSVVVQTTFSKHSTFLTCTVSKGHCRCLF